MTDPQVLAFTGILITLGAVSLVVQFKRWHDRPLTDNDRFCSAVDEALDRREQRVREDAEVAWLEEVWALPAAEVHH